MLTPTSIAVDKYIAELTNFNPLLLDELLIATCARYPAEVFLEIYSCESRSIVQKYEDLFDMKYVQFQIDIIRKLVKLDVNINLQLYDNKTAIHQACDANNLHLVKYLVQVLDVDTHLKSVQDETPLDIATSKGYSDIAEFLLGVDAELAASSHYGF